MSGNQAADDGGAIYMQGGTVNILSSSVSGNQAADDGGGIRNNSGILNMANSTLSGNQADGNGGGLRFDSGGTVNLTNVTIANNTADNSNSGSADGGGIQRVGGTINLKNNLIAANFDTPSGTGLGVKHPDLSGNFTSSGFNLIGDGTGSTGLTHGVNGDLVGSSGSPIDPLLGSLGGSPAYHPLQAASPAIDTIPVVSNCTFISTGVQSFV